jgi:hypothetical protein
LLCIGVDEVFRNVAHIEELTICRVEEWIAAQHASMFANIVIRTRAPSTTDDEFSFNVDQVRGRQGILPFGHFAMKQSAQMTSLRDAAGAMPKWVVVAMALSWPACYDAIDVAEQRSKWIMPVK